MYIALNEEVKRVAAQPNLDGTDLMRKVFSPNSPLLQLAAERAEQQGWMELFAGAIMAIRNPRAHRLNPGPDLDETIAWLVFASALFYKVEQATHTTP